MVRHFEFDPGIELCNGWLSLSVGTIGHRVRVRVRPRARARARARVGIRQLFDQDEAACKA